MAEKIVSPGVFSNEIDASFLPAAIGDIGAVVIGPTVKGPALVPTVVNSYSEFQSRFGDVFKSGSNQFQYLTSITAHNYLKHSGKLTVVRILDGTFSGATATVPSGSGGNNTGSSSPGIIESDAYSSFTLNTIADGAIMNNEASGARDVNGICTFEGFSGSIGTKNSLISGSADNVRWEISSVNPSKGTFTLLIRRGDDIINRKQILETWNNLSLDPGEDNYIVKMIGDSYMTINGRGTADPYISYTGTHGNKSKYVYVSSVNDTAEYLDETGTIRISAASASLPGLGSGSFHGGFSGGDNGYAGFNSLGRLETGTSTATPIATPYSFFENIGSTDSQGYALSSTTTDDGGKSYIDALSLLNNADEYDINLILIPGILDSGGGSGHNGIITKAIDVCESRGDCFLIYDVINHGQSSLDTVTTEAATRDSNYAATYWPWCQVSDSQTGAFRWVPPSVVMSGIYAFNDKIAAPWFAPAGLNRGGLDTVVQAERKLTHKNRDTLYDSNVNPIATFPGQGVVVWGQKTLQKKSSALDRVNVRRLMIKVKKFIAASSRFLVFEQNNATTRNRFLNIANPYLEQVQAQSGLNAFKVVMDETNNTPDIVDRNILYGQIFLQPTRTAEFIVLDFTIQPTGAAFPE